MVIAAEQLGVRDIDYGGLRKAFMTYAAGSLAAVALLIYKGLGIIYYSALGSVEPLIRHCSLAPTPLGSPSTAQPTSSWALASPGMRRRCSRA